MDKEDAVSKVHLWKPSQNHACESWALQCWCDPAKRLKWVSSFTEQAHALLPSRRSRTGVYSEQKQLYITTWAFLRLQMIMALGKAWTYASLSRLKQMLIG